VSSAHPNPVTSPGLDEIAGNPDLVRLIPPEAAGSLILKCAAVMSALAGVTYKIAGTATQPPQHEELLTVPEAAKRLSVSKYWIYQNAKNLPFTVRQGRMLRFSSNGIDDYIRKRRSPS
jgi:predicted DNA-binding transcriptional regulator AlpA